MDFQVSLQKYITLNDTGTKVFELYHPLPLIQTINLEDNKSPLFYQNREHGW